MLAGPNKKAAPAPDTRVTPAPAANTRVVPAAHSVVFTLSNAFPWKKANQQRAYHSVDRAIEIITKDPRHVGAVLLAGWLWHQGVRRCWIRCRKGPPNVYQPDRVPARSADLYPVLIGVRNGARFLIDGAHRLVRAKMEGRTAYSAIFLTEEETRLCIIPAREAQVAQAFARPFPD